MYNRNNCCIALRRGDFIKKTWEICTYLSRFRCIPINLELTSIDIALSTRRERPGKLSRVQRRKVEPLTCITLLSYTVMLNQYRKVDMRIHTNIYNQVTLNGWLLFVGDAAPSSADEDALLSFQQTTCFTARLSFASQIFVIVTQVEQAGSIIAWTTLSLRWDPTIISGQVCFKHFLQKGAELSRRFIMIFYRSCVPTRNK